MKASLIKSVATLGRWMATLLFCVGAFTLVWQGAFISNPTALAADLGDRIEKAADDVRAGSKDLIRDTESKVKKTANKNANKVDRAEGGRSYATRKADRDRVRIEERAENHAARTEKAVDKSMNAVKGAVENAKDALK